VTKSTLEKAAEHEVELISRLPATFSAVGTLISRVCEDDDWTDLGTVSDDDDAAEYKLQTFQHPIHDHELQCLVVHSSSSANRASQRINGDLNDTEDNLEDAVDQLGDRAPEVVAVTDEQARELYRIAHRSHEGNSDGEQGEQAADSGSGEGES
jgi:hypothetical protein